MGFIQGILNMFNGAMQLSYDFLTKDLDTFAPSVASVMRNINDAFVAFASALLIILTLWNIVKSATTITELKRPEVILKVFVRFGITYFLITHTWQILQAVITISGGLIARAFTASGNIVDGSWQEITAPTFTNPVMGFLSQVTGFLANFNLAVKIPELLVALIGFIVAIVLSVTLVLTVFGRFFKIYLFTALAPIPMAAFGAEDTHPIARNFVHSFIGVCLEGAVIALAMIVFAAYAGTSIFDFSSLGIFDWLGTAAEEICYMYEQIFNMLLLLGLIKGADQVVHQVFSRA